MKHIRMGEQSTVGALQGICLGGPTSYLSDGSFGRHLQIGVTQSYADGFPSTPCLSLQQPGFWRFRWVVKSGPRAVYVWAQQNSTGSAARPSMVVKSNSVVGLSSDLSASAPNGAGWQQIGPINFTATGNGIVWVELHNNLISARSASLFDHIITT
jgi:hypothetical protein